MYFQIFSLLLAYRASVIKFSKDVQNITYNENKLLGKAQELYKKYLQFMNKLYFKEVTAQDQGIELYDKAMKVMNTEKYIKDLDEEISELHNYVQMVEEKKQNNRLERISELGAVFLPPSLLTGIFGMNVIEFSNSSEALIFASTAILSSVVLGWMSLKLEGKKALLPQSLLALIFIFSLVCFPTDPTNKQSDLNQTKGDKCQIIR